MEEHGGEWGDPLAIGSVCDVVLAELVIDTSKIQDTPNSVVESWDHIDEDWDHIASAPYNVVEIKPGEPLSLAGDLEVAAALASGHESDSGASASSRGRDKKKKGKKEWRPFGRANSLSPRGRRAEVPRRMQSLPVPRRTLPRTRVLPKIKTPLKDILHKQREKEDKTKIIPAPRSKTKAYGMTSKKQPNPHRSRGSKGGIIKTFNGSSHPSGDDSPARPPAEAMSAPVNDGPSECEGMPLMVGPDGAPLAAITDDMTEEQLIAELKELDATQQAIAESGASAGRLSAVDAVAATAAILEVQERALARLNRDAELETRVRLGLEAIAASANQVFEALGSSGLASSAELAAKAGLMDAETPSSVSKIALIHEAIEQAQVGAAMFYQGPDKYNRAAIEQLAAEPSNVGDSGWVRETEPPTDPRTFHVEKEDGFFHARQQRSKHISESLLRLQEESRRLQEQSRMLQERAMAMQRQAGLSTEPLSAEPAAALPAPEADMEAASLQIEQGQIDQQIEDALAAGSHAVMDSLAALGPGPEPVRPAAMGRPPSLGAPISWSMPPKAAGHQLQQQHQQQSKPSGGSKASSSSKPKPKKSSLTSPGPERGFITRNVSILSPASAAAIRAAADADFNRSGHPAAREQERLDSPGSVDNMPILPSWSDLVSSPLTSPLKIVRNPSLPQRLQAGNPSLPPGASQQWRPEEPSGPTQPLGAVQSPRQQPAAEAPKPRRFLPSLDVDAIIRRREAAITAAQPPAPPPPPPYMPQHYGPQASYPQFYSQGVPPPPPVMSHYMMQRMMGMGGGAQEPSDAKLNGRGNYKASQSAKHNKPSISSLPYQPYGTTPHMMGYGGPSAYMFGHPGIMLSPMMVPSPYGAWGMPPGHNPGFDIAARAAVVNQRQEQHFRDVEGAVVQRIKKQTGRERSRTKL